jgi:CRP-like cAMP-binding protein
MSGQQSTTQVVSGPDMRGNRVLDALPEEELAALVDAMQLETHGLKHVLFEPGQPIRYVYFPISAVVSILTGMEDGSAVEIATIGNEGMVGAPVVIGARETVPRELTQVQVPGTVIRIDADRFSRQATGGALRDIAGRYLQAFLAQVSQQVACNGLHSVEERCSRWILLTHDRVKTDEFPLTQEFLSQMLGVRRASVTVAAGALQKAGFIRFNRGRLTVLDREGLESSACECYMAIRSEFRRLLGSD